MNNVDQFTARLQSLRFQLVMFIVVILCVMIAVIGYLVVDTWRVDQRDKLNHYLNDIEYCLKHETGSLFWRTRPSDLEVRVYYCLHYNPDISLEITDAEGRLLLSTHGVPLPHAFIRTLSEISSTHLPIAWALPDYLEYHTTLSVDGQIMGHARILFSLESMRQDLQRLLFRVGVTLLCGLLLVSVLGWKIYYWVTEPLMGLIRAVRAVARGDYHMPLPVSHHTEIRGLLHGFVEMRRTLFEQVHSLKHQRKTLHAIADYTYGWEIWLNEQAELFWMNASVERITGYTANEFLTGQRSIVDDLVHIDDKARVRATIRSALKQHSRQQGFVFRVIRKDGTLIWLSSSWQPLYDDHQNVSGLRASFLDYTEQMRAQQQLEYAVTDLQQLSSLNAHQLAETRRERARLDALLSTLQVGLVFVDARSAVVYSNPCFSHQWYLPSSDELAGRSLMDLFPPRIAEEMNFVQQAPDLNHELRADDGHVFTCTCVAVHGEENGQLWVFHDITTERMNSEQLLFLAERDMLTGLYNRRRFQSDLDLLCEDALRLQHTLTLLLLDFNDFKVVNDTHGHSAGDEVLATLSHEINCFMSPDNERFYRLGGDEFAILLPQTEPMRAYEFAERLARHIRSVEFVFDGVSRYLSTSIGVAGCPDHAVNPDKLIVAADVALYAAKEHAKKTSA